jgi:pyridoxamine 5'-phosphate oxidase
LVQTLGQARFSTAAKTFGPGLLASGSPALDTCCMSEDGATFDDPIAWFRDSFARAGKLESFDPCRAALATADAAGHPSVRFVLVKQFDERGFAFFTNYTSLKGRQLAATRHAALAFHWATIGEQVRIEGAVEVVADAEADAYFATRPRGSQLSAWASDQSAPIADRAQLEAKYAVIERRFAEATLLPRPPFWGGYRIVPARIEFWHDRHDRLHDRWSFAWASNGWQRERLQP